MRLALVASPFTRASAWRAVAERLADAVVADYGGVSGPDWYEGAAARIAAQADGAPWIAVLHSGAGGFAPALTAAAADLAGFIFADAVLPYPGRSNLETAPAEFQAMLRALTTDGLLARWDQWFGGDFVGKLVPDAATREAFLAELPRVPFDFLEAAAPDGQGWERLPSAYLQLSRAYDETADKAQARGWRVMREPLNHLAMLSHPEVVAARLAELARDMGS